RVVQKFVSDHTQGRVNPLMNAMGPNVAGVIGSAVAAGALLALVGEPAAENAALSEASVAQVQAATEVREPDAPPRNVQRHLGPKRTTALPDRTQSDFNSPASPTPVARHVETAPQEPSTLSNPVKVPAA